MNHLALLLLLLSGLVGRTNATPDIGLYDAVGRPIALPAVKLPGSVTRNAAGLPHVVSVGDLDTTYTYNTHGEVLTETTTDGQGVVFARAYTRDALGRIAAVEETEGANSRKLLYNYDIAGRLVAECHGTAVGQGDVEDPCGEDTALIAEYTYDANGNRLSRDEPGGDVDEEAEYDAQDRLVDYDGVAHTFGDRGELQSAGDWSFDYDAMGNLVQASQANGPTISYLTDPRNRRIGRDDGVTQRYWLYQDQLEPVAELDGNGNLVARFVYGVRAHSPDYMVRWEGGNEVLYRYVTDHLGSVRMVVKVSTGAVVQRLDYDAFGRVVDDTNPGFQPFGFAGGLYDADTGLVRFGARDYDPQTGRWTAKDPIRWAGGQANLYEYVASDPVNAIDPSGLRVPGKDELIAREIFLLTAPKKLSTVTSGLMIYAQYTIAYNDWWKQRPFKEWGPINNFMNVFTAGGVGPVCMDYAENLAEYLQEHVRLSDFEASRELVDVAEGVIPPLAPGEWNDEAGLVHYRVYIRRRGDGPTDYLFSFDPWMRPK